MRRREARDVVNLAIKFVTDVTTFRAAFQRLLHLIYLFYCQKLLLNKCA